MWIMLMFDLPVATKVQRGQAARFRNDLIADGFQRIQYSIYARFCPTVQRAKSNGHAAITGLPPEGHCRVLYLTDSQWRRMVVLEHRNSGKSEPEPMQLAIFGEPDQPDLPANQVE